MTASILRCSRCWRDCAGTTCPACGAPTARVDLEDNTIGGAGLSILQRAASNARRAAAPVATQLDLFGNVEPVAPSVEQLIDDLFGGL